MSNRKQPSAFSLEIERWEESGSDEEKLCLQTRIYDSTPKLW